MCAATKQGDPSLTVYLDSSIFLAWLKDENRPNNEMDGVYECFERMRKGEIQAIVSALIHTEVEVSRYSTERQAEFYKLFTMENPLQVEPTLRVCEVAGELRWFYLAEHEKTGQAKLETPDAIHLATAICHDAHEFYAFDKKVENKRLSVLDLSGSVGGRYSLVIRKPPVTTPLLDLKKKGSDAE